jgi:hypothetical protein
VCAERGQPAPVFAGPNGFRVPFWVFLAFVAIGAIYVATNLIRDAKRKSKTDNDGTSDNTVDRATPEAPK